MASNLDQLLQPGERVLHRDPTTWLPRSELGSLLAFFYCAICAAVVAIRAQSEPVVLVALLALGVTGCAFGYHWIRGLRRERDIEALLTDRRVLYWDGRDASAPIVVPLNEIAEIPPVLSVLKGVSIRKHDDETLELPRLRKGDEFAVAVRSAAELPDQTPEIRFDDAGANYTFYGLGCAILALLLFTDMSALFSTVSPASSMAVMVVGMFVGYHGARLVDLVRSRRTATIEELQAWLCPRPSHTRLRRLLQSAQFDPLYRWIAGRLYGQTIRCGITAKQSHDTLEQLLEAGERILYRSPSRWVLYNSYIFPTLVVALCLPIALLRASDILDVLIIVTAALVIWILVFLLLAFMGSLQISDESSRTLLSNRRLLHLEAGCGEREVVELQLDRIKAVSFRQNDLGRVTVTRTDGNDVEIFGVHRPQRFSRLLAEAAGLARPAGYGPFIYILPYTDIFGGLCIVLLSLGIWEFTDMSTWLPESSITQAVVFVLWVASIVLGMVLIGYLAELFIYAALRPFVPFEQARNAVCDKRDFEYGGLLGRRLGAWARQAFIRWVSLLYGRPIDAGTGAANHGV